METGFPRQSRDHPDLDFDAMGGPDPTAPDFRRMLEKGGIDSAVIVVSACFSGPLIDDFVAHGWGAPTRRRRRARRPGLLPGEI